MANAFDRTEYPVIEPARLAVGDRWMWRKVLSDFAVADYTLSYTAWLHGSNGGSETITATNDGTDFIVEVASTTTVKYEAGQYVWQSYITRDSDSERIALERGSWEVLPDTGADFDPRSKNQIDLAKAYALRTSLLDKEASSYSVAARSLVRRQLDEVDAQIRRLEHRVAIEMNTERVRRGKPSANMIRMRF